MSKYVQKYIPRVTIPKEWCGRKTYDYRNEVLNKIKTEFAGMVVENEETKIKIKITVKSAKKQQLEKQCIPKKWQLLVFCQIY